MTPTGKTKDVGWNCGVRRTFDVGVDDAWELLRAPEGMEIWLGGATPLERGPYELPDGTTGEIRVDQPGSHLRLTWQPEGWDHASTVQVRVMQAKTGATVSFHQEHLADEAERTAMLDRWERVLDELGSRLGFAPPDED